MVVFAWALADGGRPRAVNNDGRFFPMENLPPCVWERGGFFFANYIRCAAAMPDKPVIVTYTHLPKRPPRKVKAGALQVPAIVTNKKRAKLQRAERGLAWSSCAAPIAASGGAPFLLCRSRRRDGLPVST